jgi:hypothetical protein
VRADLKGRHNLETKLLTWTIEHGIDPFDRFSEALFTSNFARHTSCQELKIYILNNVLAVCQSSLTYKNLSRMFIQWVGPGKSINVLYRSGVAYGVFGPEIVGPHTTGVAAILANHTQTTAAVRPKAP